MHDSSTHDPPAVINAVHRPSGRLTAHQLRIQHAFDSIDTAKNNYIDMTEFAQLCTYLSYAEDAPHPYFLPLCEDVNLFKSEFRRLGGDDGHLDVSPDPFPLTPPLARVSSPAFRKAFRKNRRLPLKRFWLFGVAAAPPGYVAA